MDIKQRAWRGEQEIATNKTNDKKCRIMKVPKRFLVVDDDRTNNLICEFALRRFSSNVDIKTFLDPQAALQYITYSYNDEAPETPTVVFLDINMPVLSGWDFLAIFKNFPVALQQQFVIYMLTSSIDERDLERAELHPLVKASLRKPLSTKTINEIFGIEAKL